MENNLDEIITSDNELRGMREKLEKKRNDLKKIESEFREKARKKRTHHLIEVGAIAAKAAISRYDKNLLLGAFTFIAEEIKNNPYKVKEWTEIGSNIFQDDINKKTAAEK